MSRFVEPLKVLAHKNDPKKRLHNHDVKRKSKQSKPAKQRPEKPKGQGLGEMNQQTQENEQ